MIHPCSLLYILTSSAETLENFVEALDGAPLAELCLGADLQGKLTAPIILAACDFHGVVADGRVVGACLISSAKSCDDIVRGLWLWLGLLPGGGLFVVCSSHSDLALGFRG